MKIYRMLVVVGIVLIQANGANAQFGGFGNLIKKGLNQPANPPPTADSNATPTNTPSADSTTPTPNQTTTDQSQPTTPTTGSNSTNDSATLTNPNLPNKALSDEFASLSGLPPIFEAVKNCDGVKFAELIKNDTSVVNKTLYDMNWGRDGDDRYTQDKLKNRIWSYTPLDFAAAIGCTNIIQQLLDLGANINPYPNPSTIRLATAYKNLDAENILKAAKAKLEAAEKAKADEQAEKDTAALNEENASHKNERKEALQKQVLALLDQHTDSFGMANSRYRKFNGTVYDCAEPIEFLNRLFVFIPAESQYNDKPSDYTDLKERIEAEDKSLRENPWFKIEADCVLAPVQVASVTPDGLIVRLNSQQDVELLALLKNHPKQKSAVDGDVLGGQFFVLKKSPYQYTDALGVNRTIPSYDMGIVVPTPSGSVPKLPLPDASH